MEQRIKTPYGTLYRNPDRGNVWHLSGTVDLPEGGTYRFNKSCGGLSLPEARRRAKSVWEGVRDHPARKTAEGLKKPPKGEAEIAAELSEFNHAFYEVRVKNGELDQATWEDVRKTQTKFFSACRATTVSQLTPSEVTATWNRIGRIAPKYKAKVVYAVRKFIRYQIKKGNLKEDPSEEVKAPGKRLWGKGKDEEPWQENHYQAYLKACKEAKLPYVRQRDWEIFVLLRGLGISQADVYTLNETDFFEDGHGLVLDKEREKSGVRYGQPVSKKGDKLSQLCEEIIRKRMAEVPRGERFFPQGKADQERWVNDMTNRRRRIQLALGHPIRTTKGLRTMFATEKIKAGVPEFVLLRWLGHSEDSTVFRQHYLRLQSTRQWA